MATSVIMPALEMAQETGKVLKWLKAAGHTVAKGETIVEIETDKVTVEIEAPASGILGNVTAHAGDVVPVQSQQGGSNTWTLPTTGLAFPDRQGREPARRADAHDRLQNQRGELVKREAA